MKFQPFIVGSGMSAKTIRKALSIIDIVDSQLSIAPPIQLARGQELNGLPEGFENPILCVGNPHGLHAQYVLQGGDAGFTDIVLDKPACVTLNELDALRSSPVNVAVLHGFRQMWGPQTMRSMVKSGEMGDLVSLEGRYWQSSAAEVAVSDRPPRDKAWKSDLKLNGPYDTYVDLGSHWVDLMLFLAGGKPTQTRSWISHPNAIAPHRDTHVHLYIEFDAFRTLGSVSKTLHGAGNEMELMLLGTQQAVTWSLQRPDELRIGRGNEVRLLRRTPARYGSQQPPFSGTGWLEGYTEIIHSFLLRRAGVEAPCVPTLSEGLDTMEVLLNSERL